MEISIIIILCALLIIREYQHCKIIKDLMDRIMCKDWKEYKQQTKPRVAPRGFPAFMSDEKMAEIEKNGGRDVQFKD